MQTSESWPHFTKIRQSTQQATRKIYSKQFGKITWHLVATKRRARSKNWWVPFHFTACLLEESRNSFCRSQFCHVDTACSTLLSRGWLRFWLQAIVWAVAVRSLLRCCDRSPQKGQTCTHSLLEAFIAIVHPQLTGVHSIGETKDGNNSNVHWRMVQMFFRGTR